MAQIKVNLSLEKEVWEKFTELVPNRKKSHIINELITKEVKQRLREKEKSELALAFQMAANDKTRLSAIQEWDSMDTEGLE